MKREVLNLKQLSDELRAKYTARELAGAAKITTAGAYRILAGKVAPSAETLDKLGYAAVYVRKDEKPTVAVHVSPKAKPETLVAVAELAQAALHHATNVHAVSSQPQPIQPAAPQQNQVIGSILADRTIEKDEYSQA